MFVYKRKIKNFLLINYFQCKSNCMNKNYERNTTNTVRTYISTHCSTEGNPGEMDNILTGVDNLDEAPSNFLAQRDERKETRGIN